jgi:hypothetical protein
MCNLKDYSIYYHKVICTEVGFLLFCKNLKDSLEVAGLLLCCRNLKDSMMGLY